jgi:uncharacterized protein DUF4326
MKTTIANINRKERYTVYVGRAGHGEDGYFGNPHTIGKLCVKCRIIHTRRDSIEAFRRDFDQRIATDAEFRQRVEGLRGQILGCFCAPERCHAEVYVEWLVTHPPEAT